MQKLIDKYTHMLQRNERLLSVLNEQHVDTTKLTYHAGFTKGYTQAKITILEDIIDDLQELEENKKS